jgi:hypothetical protein
MTDAAIMPRIVGNTTDAALSKAMTAVGVKRADL